MHMIWHQDVMAYPPAVMLGRTHPNAGQNFVTSEHARSLRLLAVHVVMKTIGLSRNESACARCLLHFTRAIEPAPRVDRSSEIAEHAFGIPGFQREGAPAPSACSARGFCSDFKEWERCTSELTSITSRRCDRRATRQCPIQKTLSPIRLQRPRFVSVPAPMALLRICGRTDAIFRTATWSASAPTS